MWILVRLALAVIGFVVRHISRERQMSRFREGSSGGERYTSDVDRGTDDRIHGFRISMPRNSPTWIVMHRERWIDRLAKRLRLTREIQTGDRAFDQAVYVTCDHPCVGERLRETPALRDAVRRALEAGYDRVELDGATVSLERRSRTPPTDADRALLAEIHAASQCLEGEVPSRLADGFLWKAFFVEGVVWALMGYAIGAAAQWKWQRVDYHVRPLDLLPVGMGFAAGLFVVLVGLVWFVLRGSSRGQGVLIESALVLLVALPGAGVQIAADTNRLLDHAPSLWIERRVRHCEVRKHTSKGSTSYSHHLDLNRWERADSVELPDDIAVGAALCQAVVAAGKVRVELGPGRWGVPWYRSIAAGATSWRP